MSRYLVLVVVRSSRRVPRTCDVGSLLLMPLFMRSNVAVILRTSAVVCRSPLIQVCRPTGPCNSGGIKKNTPRQRLITLSREFTLDIWRNKVTLVVFHGRTVLVYMAPFRNMNSPQESIHFYAENGPFLLCYSENTDCGGARPLSCLYASGTTNGAPTRDRSIVVNGLINLSTHTHARQPLVLQSSLHCE